MQHNPVKKHKKQSPSPIYMYRLYIYFEVYIYRCAKAIIFQKTRMEFADDVGLRRRSVIHENKQNTYRSKRVTLLA